MLPTSLLDFIIPVLNIVGYRRAGVPNTNSLQFELRHVHAVTPAAEVYFSDVATSSIRAQSSLSLKFSPVKRHRPSSFKAFTNARAQSMMRGQSAALDWHEEEVPGPDVESRETLQVLAKMTNNAYYDGPQEKGWYDLGGNWTQNAPIGWEPDQDGFRGHIFVTPDNSTVVLSIKGTSIPYVGDGGPTVKKDKQNDNLLFACCCARVDWTWSTVCGCYGGGWKCDQTCVEDALIDDSLFYPSGTNLYNNLTYMYPDSNIWIIGHSLGGSLASLLGMTFGTPVVAFEAPGEKMAAGRLHLPTPPSTQHITHVYHNADPLAMGTCTGTTSMCALAGYAMESRCHSGRVIEYDTVTNLSWTPDLRKHGIEQVINNLLGKPWAPAEEVGREVPEAKEQEDCVECFSWEFGDFLNKTKFS